MTIQRKQIGPAQCHKGHEITVHHMGPDLLCHVDGKEIGNFYLDAEAARRAGVRYVDQIEKDKKDKKEQEPCAD